MRFWACSVLLIAAVSPAFAGLLVGHNPNVLDGGLNTAPPGSWSKVVLQFSGQWSDAGLQDNHDTTPDDGGDWAVGGSEGSGMSAKVNSYYYQRFTVASGQVTAGSNDIQLSGWSKAWAQWWSASDNWGWVQEAHVELWVDGVMVFDGVSSNNLNRDQWKLHAYSGTHNVTDHIEVRLHTVKGNNENDTGTLGAIWFDSRYDDVRLFACATGSAECCPTPLTVTNVAPNSYVIPPELGDEPITITGSNLDLVTGVQLTGPATIAGTITGATATQLTATFPLTEKPVGAYNLVLDRENTGSCPDLTVPEALTINCNTPNAVVHTIQNDRGLHGNSAHKVRLTGVNLAGISIVRLRKSNFRDTVSNITATNLTMVGEDLEATFDLSNAEGGRWDMVYRMNSTCATVTPASHNKSFLVYMPEITNGSFEEGYKTPDSKTVLCPMGPPDNPKAKHWDDKTSGEQHGGSHKRDGHFFGPECVDGKVQNITGAHYGGTDFISTSVSTWTLFQTIAAPNLDAQAISTAAFNIRAELAGNGGTEFEPVTMKIRLLDGTEGAVMQVLGETVLVGAFDNNGLMASPDFNAVVPAGTQYLSEPPILTIAFDFVTSGSGVTGLGYYGFWVDNVRSGIFYPPGCLDRTIWADNNDDDAVDMLDFADVQACLTTGLEEELPLPSNCGCFDRDFNGEIGEPDVVEFIKCATGPAIPWSAEAAPLCVP
jgi:hypothetical protein